MKKYFLLFLSLTSGFLNAAPPLEEDWVTPPVKGSGDITSLEETSDSMALEFYVRLVGSLKYVGAEFFFRDGSGGNNNFYVGAYSGLSHNQKRFGFLILSNGGSGSTSTSNTYGTGDVGVRLLKIYADTVGITVSIGTENSSDEFIQEASVTRAYTSFTQHPTIDYFTGYRISRRSSTYQGEYAFAREGNPLLEWENNGRSNAFSLASEYDTAADPTTAPLKIITSGTELLHDMTSLPTYTALGKWQHTDTTNTHSWTFNDATGTWQNTTTGYQWQYSDLNPSIWTDSNDGQFWGYNENVNAWTQEVHEAEES